MTNWSDIHGNFDDLLFNKERYLEEFWENHGFDHQTTKEWAEALGESFEPSNDYTFCAWLRDEKHLTAQRVKKQGNSENLKQEYRKPWADVHPDFVEKDFLDKTWQQKWKEANITLQEAKQWIQIGFEPDDCETVKQWKNHNLTSQEAKSWIDIGLATNDAEFAAYLRGKGHQPNSNLKLKQLITEFNTWKKNPPAQEYLDCFYPKNQRKQVNYLDIGQKRLQGTLDLSDFVNLEELDCSWNELTTLKLGDCLKLRKVDCRNNNLSELDCSLFNHLINLRELRIGNDYKWKINQNIYNRFYSFLESLKNLTELKILDINDTDINSGLEHLPESIEEFYCLSYYRKDAKCQVIYDLFANEKEIVEIEKGYIKNFPQKLQDYKQWRKLNFSEEEIKEWIKNGLVINEYEFANYLRQNNYPNTKEIILKEHWKDIHQNFDYQLRKVWENKGFDKEQTKEWISVGFQLSDYNYVQAWRNQNFTDKQIQEWVKVGAKPDDYEFIAWLRDTKKGTPNWIINYKEDYQILSERFRKYDLCPECDQPNTGEQWCQACNVPRLKENFNKKKWYEWNKWTSGDPQIDKFIQKYQLEATEASKFLEWIPYEQFTNIEYLAEGGFGKVYKAKWKKGPIRNWNNAILNKKWKRDKDITIVLKSLTNSSENTDFLQEVAKHKDIDDWFNNLVPCYGLSQDPETGNYLMVMQYIEGGDLRKYLANKKLTLADKLKRLNNIIQGLKDVHSKNLVHRDFHSGNILNSDIHSFITDLGLCKPVKEANQEEEIYGVLPYVAPEVLKKKGYTSASDIYSLGVVAYEIFANASPYLDREYDTYLALDICRGLRPDLDEIKIPQLLKDLIKKCWDDDPTKRPTAQELERILRKLPRETEFTRQLQAVEAEYNQMSQNTVFKAHPTAAMNSKLINTKQITQLLQPKTEEYHTKALEELTLDNFNLDELNLQEEQKETSDEIQPEQQALQIQPTNQPYGTPSSSK